MDIEILINNGLDALKSIEKAQKGSEAERQKLSENKELSLIGKARNTKGLDDQFTANVEKMRHAVLPSITEAMTELTETERKTRKAIDLQRQPSNIAEWQEVEARRGFVVEDIRRVMEDDPHKIADLYAEAVKDGEKLNAWLIERYGLEALRKHAEKKDDLIMPLHRLTKTRNLKRP